MHRKRSTSVLSFRLDDDIVNTLRKEAEEEGISLNVLANNIFRRYVEWERDAWKIGFIPVTKDFLTVLLNEINEQKIEEIVKNIVKNVKSHILYMENAYDLSSFLKWMEVTNRISGFAQKKVIDGKTQKYIIQHDLNMNWSIYMKTLYENILEDLYDRKVEFDITHSTVIFKIER